MLSGVERNGVLEIVGGRNVVVWRCDSKTREEQPPAIIASRVIICWPPGLFLHSIFSVHFFRPSISRLQQVQFHAKPAYLVVLSDIWHQHYIRPPGTVVSKTHDVS